MNSAKVINELKNAGLRLTFARKQIIKLLCRFECPISAPELLSKISVNKSTIYRELIVLKKAGFIAQVDLGDGIKRYESSQSDHHHHLVCLKCRSVTEVKLNDDFTREEKLIESKQKFKILKHNLEFFGYCHSCS